MFTDPVLTKKVLAERLQLTDAVVYQAYAVATYMFRLPTEMGDNDEYYEYLKTNFANPDQIESTDVLIPEIDLFAEIEAEGFFDRLEQEYGPLPAKPTSSGL